MTWIYWPQITQITQIKEQKTNLLLACHKPVRRAGTSGNENGEHHPPLGTSAGTIIIKLFNLRNLRNLRPNNQSPQSQSRHFRKQYNESNRSKGTKAS